MFSWSSCVSIQFTRLLSIDPGFFFQPEMVFFSSDEFAESLSSVILNFWMWNSCLKKSYLRVAWVAKRHKVSLCALAVLPASADGLEHVFSSSCSCIFRLAVLGCHRDWYYAHRTCQGVERWCRLCFTQSSSRQVVSSFYLSCEYSWETTKSCYLSSWKKLGKPFTSDSLGLCLDYYDLLYRSSWYENE